MKPEHIKRYIGLPVIVQLRDAMALGSVPGPMQAAPACNEQGELLMKDGSVAPKDAKPDAISYRPAWPIAVRREGKEESPVFRFAIEGAMISMVAPLTGPLSDAELVHIHYTEEQTLYELAVEPAAIVGITCVRQGPMPEAQAGLILPGRN
ncbi:MAG TPA: hypothetical protein VGB13_13410 [Candidatus Krumholzibacteria bacterium]